MKTHSTILAAIAALIFPLAAMADETQIVVATGTGNAVASAKKDAYRAAVEKVVGTLVDADTLVENDELIRDQVLTYSAAYVETAEVIGQPEKSAEGLIRVRVKAIVRKTKLEEKLRAVTSTSVVVSGEGLFAQMVSQQSQWEDAKKMIDSVFDKLPLKVLEATIVKKPDETPDVAMDPKTGEVSVLVQLRVVREKYDLLVKEIDRKIGPIAVFREDVFPRRAQTGNPENGKSYFFDGFPKARKRRYENAKSLFLVKDLQKRTAILYEFDNNAFDRIRPYFWDGKEYGGHPASRLVVRVAMLDRNGDEIGYGTCPLANRDGDPYHSVCGLVEGSNASSDNCRPQNRLMIAPLPELPMGTGYPMSNDMEYYVRIPESENRYNRSAALNYEDGSAVRSGSAMRFRIKLGSYTADQLNQVSKMKCDLELVPVN